MNPQEMHIGVNFILQKINSKAIDVFEPEEIDWALSEEQLRYIRQRTNDRSNSKRQGFQANQKRYDDIRALITPGIIPMFVRDNDSVYGNLPANYFSLVNDRSLVHDLCGTSFSSLTTAFVTYYIAVVPMDKAYNFYDGATLKKDTTSIMNIPSTYPTVAAALVAQSSLFTLINLVLQNFNTLVPNTQVFWENYNNTYYQNSFVFVSTVPFTTMSWTDGSSTYTYNSTNTTRLTYYTSLTPTERPNRLTDTGDLHLCLNSAFENTQADSPISTLEGRQIHVYHKQKFILNRVNIDYIRKPRKIDLALNQSSELDPNSHDELVSNTAQRLAGLYEAGNYKQIINENLLQE